MKSKRMVVALGVLVLTGVSAAGYAATRTGFGPEKAEKYVTFRVNDALDDLEATDAQRTRVLAIKDRLFADGKQQFGEHREMRTALVAEWEKDAPDADRVHALIDTRADALRAFAHRVADAVLEVHAILTPEQRAQVTEHLQSRAGCGHP